MGYGPAQDLNLDLSRPMTTFTGQDLSCFRGQRLVFTGLSFALQAGDALILRGANGSGKSTLLRIMAGLLTPLDGDVRWSDGDATIAADPDTHQGRIHYVGHADAIKPVLSVAENIGFWAGLRTPTPDVAGAMKTLGIAALADIPGRFLSAGQRRRVNLARILAAPADLWLLDEPTTALDASAVVAVRDAVARHRAGGGMVVASTHQDLGLDNAAELNLDAYAAEDPVFV